MNPRPVSRINCGDGDRLTRLPDHIRLHILTFLPIKDAVRTTRLSKGWVNLWTHLTTLVFAFKPEKGVSRDRALHQFTYFVDRVLLFLNSQHLDRFSISFDYIARYHESLVYSWLRFAVNRNVKRIDLLLELRWEDLEDPDEIDDYEYDGPMCTIPGFLLKNDVLVSLNLKNCRLSTPIGEIKCKSLTSLSFSSCGDVCLDDEYVAKLLLGCPVLETFKVDGCSFDGIIDLKICHEGLKELFISCYNYYGGKLIISAPNVTSLTFAGYIVSKCQFRNLSSVMEAFIDLQYYLAKSEVEKGIGEAQSNIKDVLARMPHIKKLTIGSECLEAISLLDTTHPSFSISSCRSLILRTCLDRLHLRGVVWLLRSCHQLETLTVNVVAPTVELAKESSGSDSDQSSSSEIDDARTSFLKSELSDGYFSFLDHLKNVNVIGPVAHHPETEHVTEFLQFILEHAKVLKYLTIKAKRDDGSTSDGHSCLNSHFELARMLLSFPRLSREAEIHLTALRQTSDE